MNAKIGTVLLVVACVALAVALVTLKQQADAQRVQSASTISEISNHVAQARLQNEELKQANLNLNNDLATNRQMSLALSNQLTAQLTETAGSLVATEASLQGARQQITNLNSHITDLEAQNQALDQRANSLSNTIASLNMQIASTQMELASSKTNNAFLVKQLQQLRTEKKKLEDQFNDLAEVRGQMHKLRTDMLVAQRLEWMRQGIDPTKPMKGGQLLMQRTLPVPGAAAGPSPYNLNVEVGSDGSVHVLPPATNAPAK
jgi:hypothetical protein